MSDLSYVASVSGGKDSTAMCLHLREQGIPFSAVFFDTGLNDGCMRWGMCDLAGSDP